MDTLFFIFSKVIWWLISPDLILVSLAVICILLFWYDRKSLAKKLAIFILPCLLLLSCFPLGGWLLYPLENRFPSNPEMPDEVHGIIVLGGAEKLSMSREWNQLEVNEAAERIFYFMRLTHQYPRAKAIFSGGSGNPVAQDLSSAALVKRYLVELGVDIGKVMFEEKSRNTYENVKFSHELVQPKPEENWVLITTAWHMPRAVGIFNQLNWKVIPYPVDHRVRPDKIWKLSISFSGNLALFKVAIKEWIGLFAYYFSGKTKQLLP